VIHVDNDLIVGRLYALILPASVFVTKLSAYPLYRVQRNVDR